MVCVIWICADESSPEVGEQPTRSTRVRKPNRYYTENYDTPINKHQKARKIPGQQLSEIQNWTKVSDKAPQDYPLQEMEGIQCQAGSFTDADVITPDVSLLMSSSIMEQLDGALPRELPLDEIIHQLTSSPIPGHNLKMQVHIPSIEFHEVEAVDSVVVDEAGREVGREAGREADGQAVGEAVGEAGREAVGQAGKTTTRKRKRNVEQWKCNVRKSKKAKGEAYISTGGRFVPCKQVLPVTCKCTLKCSDVFSHEVRSSICAEYYALGDYCRQKDYILQRLVIRPVQTRRVMSRGEGGSEAFSMNRQVSVAYHLEHAGSRHRVCQAFFLKTLCLSNRAVQTAIHGRTDSGTFGHVDRRGRLPPVNKTNAARADAVREHIRSFPTVQSHYCRKDSQRQYLDSKLTINKMYDLYVENCRNVFSENYKPVSACVYRRIFNEEFNLSFYKPKKDQCGECSKFELMTAGDKEGYRIEIQEHLARNKEAQAAKANDKQRASENAAFRSVTFDLQSVLQVPSSDASLMYYKRKLCCYNFTVYEQAAPNDAHCYLWSEVDGKRGSNEIGSCLLKYLMTLPSTVEEVSMFSDTCGGQNRNQNVAAVLLYAV